MSSPAPIALFAFDRPDRTRATIAALAANDLAARSKLTIFCDGPRLPGDADRVAEVRAIAREAAGFAAVDVVERAQHLGPSRSIIAGVTGMLEMSEEVIVLEDDMMTSPCFLEFMNRGLSCYAAEERVAAICGLTPRLDDSPPETYFLPGTHCWGWGTWRRSWAAFEPDAARLLQQIVERDLIYTFDFNGVDPLTQALQQVAMGASDWWVPRWLASAIVRGRLTLYAGRSLVLKTGHSGALGAVFTSELAERCPRVERAPLEVDAAVMARIRSALVRWRRGRSRKEWLYYRLAALLPERIERELYAAIVRRSLTRNDRGAADEP
jgi:hypothetical protein